MELKHSLDELLIKAKECDKYLMNMCKDRTQNHRNCAMPRCCGICNKIKYCEGYCKYLKDFNT